MGVEGSEELATSVVNAIADDILLGDKSAINTSVSKYIEAGYSEEKARELANNDFLLSLGLDALAGAASGAVFGHISASGQLTSAQRKAIETSIANSQANTSDATTEAKRLYSEAAQALASEWAKNDNKKADEKAGTEEKVFPEEKVDVSSEDNIFGDDSDFVEGELFDTSAEPVRVNEESRPEVTFDEIMELMDTKPSKADTDAVFDAMDRENVTEEILDETSSIELERDFDDYPYNAQKVLKDYTDSVDNRIIDFAKKMETDNSFDRLNLDIITSKTANDISSLVGFDVDGYRLAMNTSSFEHIEKRHGKNGEHDHSMQNIEDLARIPYIAENYDTIELAKNKDDTIATTDAFKNSDNTPAKIVKLTKKINGTFYVIEAVPENSYKKLWVLSSYISKDGVTQVSDAVNTTPDSKSSETPLASLPSDNSISENELGVKRGDAVYKKMAELYEKKGSDKRACRLRQLILPLQL